MTDQTETGLGHNEATVLSFTKVRTPDGFYHSITMRQGMTNAEMQSQIANIEKLDAKMISMGWQPAEAGRRQTSPQQSPALQSPQGQPPSPQASAPAPRPAATPAAGNGGNGGGTDTRKCISLACTTDKGKQFWKVQVEGWKFPIAIYPEVLERYFNVAELNPTLEYQLEGRVATYEKNEKGNPKKVLSLSEAKGVA